MAASVRTLQRFARRSLPSPLTTRRLAFSTTACARTIENPREQYRAFQRQGEADETLRRRLIYQSRYRGTLESDLLMSTFAADHLPTMNRAQLEEYDQFLLEEDWDIYYWATQDPKDLASLASRGEAATSPSSSSAASTPAGQPAATEDSYKREPVPGEWARIAGNFEAGYRPVPERWRDTELLRKLRQHVLDKSAGADGNGGGGGGMSARPLLFGKGTEKD